jgi:hypothetical protein
LDPVIALGSDDVAVIAFNEHAITVDYGDNCIIFEMVATKLI